jgi:aminoglycoside/choline kinase family phosphotransferase
LVANALQQPGVFVHRDYHSRNLMFVDGRNPGILDFQDAVEGPYTYDLVSLLKDCYISWPAEKVLQFATSFFDKRRGELPDDIDRATFLRHFELMGVQRQLKAAGIFARLNHRDGKRGYMLDIPRTLNYVLEVAPRYPDLEWLAKLIAEMVLPELARENT